MLLLSAPDQLGQDVAAPDVCLAFSHSVEQSSDGWPSQSDLLEVIRLDVIEVGEATYLRKIKKAIMGGWLGWESVGSRAKWDRNCYSLADRRGFSQKIPPTAHPRVVRRANPTPGHRN